MLNRNHCQQQQSTTALESTFKCKNGKDQLHPKDWGWQECEEGFVSIQATLPPAPEHLLREIRCNCKTDCSTLR